MRASMGRKSTFLALFLSVLSGCQAEENCFIPVTHFDKGTQPIYIDATGVNHVLYPHIEHPQSLIIEHDHWVRVSCPFNHLVVNGTKMEESFAYFQCIGADNFTFSGLPNEIYAMDQVECLSNSSTVIATVKNPMPTKTSYIYGYMTSILDFQKTLVFHFDKAGTWSLVLSALQPTIHKRQITDDVPPMKVGNHLKKFEKEIAKMYTVDFQRQQLAYTLHGQKHASNYIDDAGTNHLAPTKLIGHNTFYYVRDQAITYTYENLVPMWKSIKEGNWERSDRALKALARDITSRAVTYGAGAIDILTLEGAKGHKEKIVLQLNHTEAFIPAPKIVYRFFQDTVTSKGFAMLTVNNPFMQKITPDLHLCTPDKRCDLFYPEFLQISRGYTYCCSYTDFFKCCLAGKVTAVNQSEYFSDRM